jgi:hypothetical protein
MEVVDSEGRFSDCGSIPIAAGRATQALQRPERVPAKGGCGAASIRSFEQ